MATSPHGLGGIGQASRGARRCWCIELENLGAPAAPLCTHRTRHQPTPRHQTTTMCESLCSPGMSAVGRQLGGAAAAAATHHHQHNVAGVGVGAARVGVVAVKPHPEWQHSTHVRLLKPLRRMWLWGGASRSPPHPPDHAASCLVGKDTVAREVNFTPV